jgi:hypothetical protein
MLLWRRALPLIAVLTLANPVLGQHATVNTERELREALIRQRAVAPTTVKIIAADGERSGGAIAQLTSPSRPTMRMAFRCVTARRAPSETLTPLARCAVLRRNPAT